MNAGVRIVQIVADGRPGGGSTVVLGLIDGLRADGRAALTLVSQPDSYLEQEARARGVDFVGVDLFGVPGDPRIGRRLAQALRPRRFDLSHLHGLRAAHYAAGAAAGAAFGRRVYTVHGLHQRHWPQPARGLADLAERRVMRRVDARVFVSQADRAAAQRHRLIAPALDAQVVHNGIDLPAVEALAREQRDIDIVFVGRLDLPKGPLQAARVLAMLAAEGRRCLLAGDGPLREATDRVLRQMPGGARVERLGALGHRSALALVARARVLLMPSLWEGLPLLPMEAMALGVPVIASRLPGTAEVLDGGRVGVLVEPGDVAAFADAARRMLDDPPRQQALRAAGRVHVRRCFDQTRCVAEYAALYARVLERAA